MAAGYTEDEAKRMMAAEGFVGGASASGGILTKRGGKRISAAQLRRALG